MKCIVCGARSGLDFQKNGFRFLKCDSCGLVFVDPSQIKKGYLHQYEENLSSTFEYYRLTESYDVPSFEKRLQFLSKGYPKAKTLLEVGSSSGTFLRTAKRFGYVVAGVEPNKSVVQEYKTRNKGILVYNHFFDEKFVKGHGQKYDIIYSSDCMEHMSDPVRFLRNARSLLNPGGIIVTVVPDYDSVLTKWFQVKPTEHLIYLTKRNVQKLYARSGLDIVEMRNFHRYRSIRAMMESTTFTDKNNNGRMMPLVKVILALRLYRPVELFLDCFKEDVMIVAKVK